LGRHGRDHLSYLLAEESSNPRFRKNGRSGNQEKTASLLYPVGRGWRNAKKWASGNQEKTASLLYPWVGMEMSWTMHPEIISLGRDGNVLDDASGKNQAKVAITTVHFPEGNSSGDLGSWGHNCLNRVKIFCSPALGIDLRGSIVLDQGG